MEDFKMLSEDETVKLLAEKERTQKMSAAFYRVTTLKTSFGILKLPKNKQTVLKCKDMQCRSKGNISGGACERRRRKLLGGSGGMLPQKILKSRGLEMLFPAFSKSYLWFTHIANYLLRTLSQQTNAHWEYNTCNVNYKIENQLSLYLETSKCFTFQSHHSKFVVIKLSELP